MFKCQKILGDYTVMSAPLLRQIWQMIEEIPHHSMGRLDDSGLVTWVLSHLENRQHMQTDERKAAEGYLYDHMMLIRDIADSQQQLCCPLVG